jgi:hypothetical protein
MEQLDKHLINIKLKQLKQKNWSGFKYGETKI